MPKNPRPVLLVLDEAALPTSAEASVRFLDSVVQHAPAGSELLMAFDAAGPLRLNALRRNRAALELDLPGSSGSCCYPRLRFLADHEHEPDLRTSLSGINAIARIRRGHAAPALAHLAVI